MLWHHVALSLLQHEVCGRRGLGFRVRVTSRARPSTAHQQCLETPLACSAHTWQRRHLDSEVRVQILNASFYLLSPLLPTWLREAGFSESILRCAAPASWSSFCRACRAATAVACAPGVPRLPTTAASACPPAYL